MYYVNNCNYNHINLRSGAIFFGAGEHERLIAGYNHIGTMKQKLPWQITFTLFTGIIQVSEL